MHSLGLKCENAELCNFHHFKINQAIADGCDSVEALGTALKCGTNCGSCKSELSAMITGFTHSQDNDQTHDAANKVIPINVISDDIASMHQHGDENTSATHSSLSREQD